jgi:glycosyltransferase involved in cell wall biosynthesis
MAILEAAAVGTPSVALNAPGVRDAIRDGKTGVLVEAPAEAPAEESAKVLAEAWVDLSGDPDRRARMGEEARLWAERFGWDRTVEAWEKLLEREIASGTHRRLADRCGQASTATTGDRVQE